MDTPKLIEVVGLKKATSKSKTKRTYAIFECPICGNTFEATISSVKSGNTKSCGCIQIRKAERRESVNHGYSGEHLYTIYNAMLQRCYYVKNLSYSNYGGRGIMVCKEWKDNYLEFRNWAFSNGYGEKLNLSIDRIDVNGNYTPTNCRWVDKVTQSRNTKLLRSDNSTGFRGVIKSKYNKYIVKIGIEGIRFYLGSFKTPLEASYAYDLFVYYHNLEHTTNHPKESYTEEQLSQPQKPLPTSKNKSQE